MALVHTAGQNIDRIVSIFKASKRTRRKLIIDLYTAAILEATGNDNLPQSYWSDVVLYVPQSQRVQVKKNAWFDLLKRHSANRLFIENLQQLSRKSTLLFRPLHRIDLERGNCLSGATYVYSQWEGYPITRMESHAENGNQGEEGYGHTTIPTKIEFLKFAYSPAILIDRKINPISN